MERMVNGYDDPNLLLRGIDRSTGKYDYEELLALSNALHPEAFCIKHVPAAAIVETDLGVIQMYAINGKPHSTPAHVREYQVDNLITMVDAIPPGVKERYALGLALSQAEPGTLISCRDLHEISQAERCIKGFSTHEPSRATRSSEEFCPNSRAGCTERILIEWARFAVALQQATGHSTLIIPDMRFDIDSPHAMVTFARDFGHPYEELGVYDPGKLAPGSFDMCLISQILPCHICSSALVDAGVGEVCFHELSRYVDDYNGTVTIDREDLGSIKHMSESGVHLVCNSAKVPVLRN